jgi:transcription antitermination factor NusG
VAYPLLGRYLLVELALDWPRQFQAMAHVRDVVGIMHRDERPGVAREHEVARLKSMERRGYVELPKRTRFAYDQRVTVTRGPFVTLEACYKEERGVLDVVELQLFGGARSIVLQEGSLTAG